MDFADLLAVPRPSDDYDIEAYIKKYGVPKGGGHLTDEFKRPNHMTFSDESVYSNENTPGGQWTREPDGTWSYTPSLFNLTQHSPEEMREYFNRVEKGNKLKLPIPMR